MPVANNDMEMHVDFLRQEIATTVICLIKNTAICVCANFHALSPFGMPGL